MTTHETSPLTDIDPDAPVNEIPSVTGHACIQSYL
ncbi:MAG: hypothetical protein ACJA1F_003373, partial [Paracoccaceae bacterium]